MVDDPTKRGGFRPPPPATLPSVPPVAADRPFSNEIPRTAGEVDPNIDAHNATSRRKGRSDFRHGGEDFQRLVLQHGKRVVWRKAMLCPCIREDTGQADLGCTECDGSGFIYVDPLPIQALMFEFDAKTRLYEKFGLWVSGNVSVTVESAYRIAWRDSIEMVDDLMSFNELVKKGEHRGRTSLLPAGEDAGRYRIAAMTRALYRDAQGNVQPLEQGFHFELTDDGHIRWLPSGNKLLPAGSYVSIHYDFHPVWMVISHPHAARSDISGTKTPQERVISLPLQASAQLDFLTDSEKPLPVTGSI